MTFAIQALGLFKNKSIREFALKQIAIGKHPTLFVELLKENYKKGDHKLLTALIANSNKGIELEGLIIDITNIYYANKTPECRSHWRHFMINTTAVCAGNMLLKY